MNPYNEKNQLESELEISRMLADLTSAVRAEYAANGTSDKWWDLQYRLVVLRSFRDQAKEETRLRGIYEELKASKPKYKNSDFADVFADDPYGFQ